MNTTLSKNMEMDKSNEMGGGSYLYPLVNLLWRGITLAILSFSRNIPVNSDWLMISCRGFNSTGANISNFN